MPDHKLAQDVFMQKRIVKRGDKDGLFKISMRSLAAFDLYHQAQLNKNNNKVQKEKKMNTTQESSFGANTKIANKVDTRILLMVLWVFFTVNFMYADTLSALEPGVLAMEMSGYVADGTIKITDGFLLGTAVMFEIPFLMIALSRVLKYGVNRWANIIAAVLFIVAQISSLFMGAPSPAYLFFSTVEIVGLLLIVWTALKWSNPEG